jgi:Xaa-Pro aminopeptidase
MKEEFSAEFFRGNRERLQKLFAGQAPIVLSANGLLQKSTDTPHSFKQDGNFWYLTGIDEPNIVVVIDKGREYLIVPELSSTRIAFDGAIDTAHLAEASGIEEILPEKAGWKRLGARLKKASSVAVLAPPPHYLESLGMYTNPARARLLKTMKSYNPKLTPLDLRQHLGRMRMVKQPAELEVLGKAIAITTDALEQVHKKFLRQKYEYEYDIELDLSRAFWKNGASGHSFDAIVAAGKKGATIHPTGNNGKILYDQSLLLDVGAEYNHYAADISRTWMLEPSKRFTAVHAAVRQTADYAMSLLKPGVGLRAYEKKVHLYMGEKLRELGLIKTIDTESVRTYFPHGTSHFLGIDVHDVGDYEQPLEAGVVMTVEPGIYIPREGIGMRIEDDVLITATACTNLSSALKR